MLSRNLVLVLAGFFLSLPVFPKTSLAADKDRDDLKKEVLKSVEKLIDKKLSDFRKELLGDIKEMLERHRAQAPRPDAAPDQPDRPRVRVAPEREGGRFQGPEVRPERGFRIETRKQEGDRKKADSDRKEPEGERRVRVMRLSPRGEGKEEVEVEVEVLPEGPGAGRKKAFPFGSPDGKGFGLRLEGGEGKGGKPRIIITRDGKTIEREFDFGNLPRILERFGGERPEGFDLKKMIEKFMSGELPPEAREFAEKFRPREGRQEPGRGGFERDSEKRDAPARKDERPGKQRAERDRSALERTFEDLRAEKEELQRELDELKDMLRRLIDKKKSRK